MRPSCAITSASNHVSLWGLNTPGGATIRIGRPSPIRPAQTISSDRQPITPAGLRASFEAVGPMTVGIEEELMLLDPRTYDLVPRAPDVLGRLEGDARFKPELPAAQIELLSTPAADVVEAAGQLREGRHDLVAAGEGVAVPAGAGTHPHAEPEGPLTGGERYRSTREEYGPVARRQLVFGLHVHVGVAGADRALAVFNALRSYLPELAALAANAPFHGGRDTEMASARPGISQMLPRQGVPPAVASFDELAAALEWGACSGSFADPRHWWWEARLHPTYGTVEVRAPDQQTTVEETAAVAAVVHALVAWLGARHDLGETLPVHPSWRIAENRWSAARHGVEGTMADLETGRRRATRARLHDLLDGLQEAAGEVGAEPGLARAWKLIEENGAMRQRAWAARGGPGGVARVLAERFCA